MTFSTNTSNLLSRFTLQLCIALTAIIATSTAANADIWTDIVRNAERCRGQSLEIQDGLAQFGQSRIYRQLLAENAKIQDAASRIRSSARQSSFSARAWEAELDYMDNSIYELEELIGTARLRSQRGLDPRVFGCTLYLDELVTNLIAESNDLRRTTNSLAEFYAARTARYRQPYAQANVYQPARETCPSEQGRSERWIAQAQAAGIYGGYYNRPEFGRARNVEREFQPRLDPRLDPRQMDQQQFDPLAPIPESLRGSTIELPEMIDTSIPQIAPNYQPVLPPQTGNETFETYPGDIPKGTVLPEGTIIDGPFIHGPDSGQRQTPAEQSPFIEVLPGNPAISPSIPDQGQGQGFNKSAANDLNSILLDLPVRTVPSSIKPLISGPDQGNSPEN